MPSSNPHDDRQRIGDFEIVRERGRGGMGVVYEARQRSLNRRVALKVLSPGLGLTTKAVMRFKREAEAAAKLHHTNIVPIYSTGDEDGIPYYAMELVDGPSLDQVIRQMRSGPDSVSKASLDSTDDASSEQQNALPNWVAGTICFETPESEGPASVSDSDSGITSSIGSGSKFYDKVAGMMSDVADALAHAHDQGVIHRDIKPSNLLLSHDGRLSINDFGLARMLEQPGMTMTGEFMGSPTYMSPEQITAGRIPLDHRTDIYSLGTTLYELLTLQPPFAGKQRDQVLSKIIHKEPSRPRTINKQIPRDLETICLKAMEKDPDRRYQTAEQMARDLRCFVNRHAISARRIGPVERGVRWARKNKALTAMACITLLVGAVAAAFVYRSSLAEQQLRSEREQMLREEAMEDALTAAMSGRLVEALEYIGLADTHGAEADWTLVLQSQVDLFEGKSKDALNKLEAAVRLNPGDVMARYMLARAYLANGQWIAHVEKVRELEGLQPLTAEEKLFKGEALVIHAPQEAIRLMGEAIKDRPDFYLARVMRANARVFQALDQGGDVEPILEALKDLDRVSGFLEASPVLSQARLRARLAAVHLYRRAGDKLADKYLGEAAVDVEHLAQFPSYFSGNHWRLFYYAFTSDFKGMERVMQDISNNGHRGFISDPYWTACYREGRFDDALKKIDQLPNQGDNFMGWRRVFFQLESASGQIDSQEMFQEIRRETVQRQVNNLFDVQILLLLGEHEEAANATRKLLEERPESEYVDISRYILQYQVGQINEGALIARAGASERNLVDAHFAIGFDKLAHGDRAGARQSFENAAASTLYYWTSFVWSREFAARLGKDPKWPQWLPPEPDGVMKK